MFCEFCREPYRSKAHRCESYQIFYGSTVYNIAATIPERAIERLSEGLNKEIFAEIGGVEYVSEEIEPGNFAAYEVFNNKTSITRKKDIDYATNN
jgi:hypothetical protein